MNLAIYKRAGGGLTTSGGNGALAVDLRASATSIRVFVRAAADNRSWDAAAGVRWDRNVLAITKAKRLRADSGNIQTVRIDAVKVGSPLQDAKVLDSQSQTDGVRAGRLHRLVVTDYHVSFQDGFFALVKDLVGLAGRVRVADIRQHASSDDDIESVGESHTLHEATVIRKQELFVDWTTDALNVKPLHALNAVGDGEMRLVHDDREIIGRVIRAGGNWNKVAERDVVIRRALGQRQTAIESVNSGVGKHQGKEPSLSRVKSTKLTSSVERVLVYAYRGLKEALEPLGLERHATRDFDFAPESRNSERLVANEQTRI